MLGKKHLNKMGTIGFKTETVMRSRNNGLDGLFWIVFAMYVFNCSGNTDSWVTLTLGTVIGTNEMLNGIPYSKFLNVPYAEPPIGNLRFRPPMELSRFPKDPLMATAYGPMCIQVPSELNYQELTILNTYATPTDLPSTMDEDCLSLNIIVPDVPGNENNFTDFNFPVMVWFHGGMFEHGTSSDFDGTALATAGKVIVVTINYRLGFLGFLNTGRNSGTRGNFGILDQQLALQWVRDYISNFGGNPSKVTILGDEAGSQSASLHLFIDSGLTLFQRVILHNDVLLPSYLDDSNAAENTLQYAKMVGCRDENVQSFTHLDDAVDCLRYRNVEDLLQIYTSLKRRGGRRWTPVFDESLFQLPERTSENGERYSIANQNVLVGLTSSGFFADFHYLFPGLTLSEGNVSKEQFDELVMFIVGSFDTNEKEILAASIRQYYTNWQDPDSNKLRAQSALKLISDWSRLYPIYDFLRNWNVNQASNQSVYFYNFNRKNSSFDSPAFFELLAGAQGQEKHNFTPELLFSLWSNFAKTGNPNLPEQLPFSWPSFDFQDEEYLTFGHGSNFEVDRKYRPRSVAFWLDYISQIVDHSNRATPTPGGEDERDLVWGLEPVAATNLCIVLFILTLLSAGSFMLLLAAFCGQRKALQDEMEQKFKWMEKVFSQGDVRSRDDSSGWHRNGRSNRAYNGNISTLPNHINFFQVGEDEDGTLLINPARSPLSLQVDDTLETFNHDPTTETFTHDPTTETFNHDPTTETFNHDPTTEIFTHDPTTETFNHDHTTETFSELYIPPNENMSDESTFL